MNILDSYDNMTDKEYINTIMKYDSKETKKEIAYEFTSFDASRYIYSLNQLLTAGRTCFGETTAFDFPDSEHYIADAKEFLRINNKPIQNRVYSRFYSYDALITFEDFFTGLEEAQILYARDFPERYERDKNLINDLMAQLKIKYNISKIV